MTKTSILLADDHQLLREGLAGLLDKEPDMDVVGQASDGLEALTLTHDLNPNVVIMDLTMAGMNGIEATRQITAAAPSVKVLCLSVHGEQAFVSAVLEAGASGYLLKNCVFQELVKAIHTVMANRIYLGPNVTGVVVKAYKGRRTEPGPSSLSQLTTRERQILQLLAEGHSAREIAERLHLSIKTVGTHREHLMAKLDLHSVADLTKYAIREGVTSL